MFRPAVPVQLVVFVVLRLSLNFKRESITTRSKGGGPTSPETLLGEQIRREIG